MLKLSNFPFNTLKSRPIISDNISTSILLQAWFIRQTMAWVYEYLPLWYRVLKNIEEIVRQEMNKAGYHEMLMSILTPKELWEKTNRWEIPEYFKVPAWWNAEYRISPTNEENVSPILNEFIQSYKDLPTCVYHIQKKFRNEKRAKSWLLRWREFVMKDAYSFHADIKDFDKFYKWAINAYFSVFERLWLWKDTVMADADWWAISDKNSHEFQTFLSIWEDIIVQDSTWYCYNLEIASWMPDIKNLWDTELDMEYIDSIPEIVSMEKMTSYFAHPDWQMLKTVVYKTESWKYFSIVIRWDLEVNEIKVRKFVAKMYSENYTQATEEDLQELWTVRWFITPLKVSSLKLDSYWDESLKTVKNFFWWANNIAKSTKNINIKDLDILEFWDFNVPKEWFTSLNKEWEKLTFRKACEVWNIFHLWTKYSKPFWLSFLDENNKMVTDVEMWCYGIWVSRLMWVIAEYFMWEKGINWPESVAPADYYIIVIWEDNLEKATEIAEKLESEWKEIILDDRMSKKIGFGQKAWDCELFGIPNRIVVSPKTVELWWYELTKRGQESKIIKF